MSEQVIPGTPEKQQEGQCAGLGSAGMSKWGEGESPPNTQGLESHCEDLSFPLGEMGASGDAVEEGLNPIEALVGSFWFHDGDKVWGVGRGEQGTHSLYATDHLENPVVPALCRTGKGDISGQRQQAPQWAFLPPFVFSRQLHNPWVLPHGLSPLLVMAPHTFCCFQWPQETLLPAGHLLPGKEFNLFANHSWPGGEDWPDPDGALHVTTGAFFRSSVQQHSGTRLVWMFLYFSRSSEGHGGI
jgi:hypothetical protein